jgi:hypothetical protein
MYNCVHGKDDNANQFDLLHEGTNNRYKNIYEVVDCPEVTHSSPTTKCIVKPIYGKAQTTFRHGFLDSSKKLPSGKKIEDLLDHILDDAQ